MQVSQKDLNEYKRIHKAHLTDTSCDVSKHSAREKRMADIAKKYNMDSNTFLWQVVNK